jgi:hypothetical protein
MERAQREAIERSRKAKANNSLIKTLGSGSNALPE